MTVRARLWCTLGLAAFADALLAPFYPQLFVQLFAADAVMTPGVYIALCRTAVAMALPLWARRARTTPPLRLIAAAQCLAALASFACTRAPTLGAFLALSFVVEACRTSYLLLYPLLAASVSDDARGVVVARASALVNGSALLSAVVGGFVLARLGGRTAIALTAVADLAQLALLAPLLRDAATAHAPEPAKASASEEAPRGPSRRERPLWAIAAIGFCATFAVVLLRPHFTLFASARMPSAPLPALGALFAVPSVLAVVALPFASAWTRGSRAGALLPAAAAVLALSCAAQYASHGLLLLVLARAAHGLASYVVDVAVDKATLASAGDALGRFGDVHALQNVAIVVVPLAASGLVATASFGALFLTASAAAGAAAVLALATREAPIRLVPSMQSDS